MFFDTNVLIKYLDPDCEEVLLNFVTDKSLKDKAFISGIVLSEILAYQGYNEKQAKDVEKFLKENFIIYDVGDTVLVLASKIGRKRKQLTGKKLKLTDAIIAATAILNKKQLLTFDQEDFKNIAKLTLFNVS